MWIRQPGSSTRRQPRQTARIEARRDAAGLVLLFLGEPICALLSILDLEGEVTRERAWAVTKHWGAPILVALLLAVSYVQINARWTKHIEQHRQMEEVIQLLNYAIQSGQLKLPKR